MPFVSSAKARLWFATVGKGSPVVLVHGGLLEPMAGARFWIEPGIAEALGNAGFHILVPDRRFSGGRTSAPIDVHTWDIEASDLLAILQSAMAERAHIVAGSNGVSAAIRFARRFPGHILSLTLCWPSPPDNDAPHAMFEHARAVISGVGPAGYVDSVRGAPGPDPRPSLLFQHVLEHGGAVADGFARLTIEEATRIVTTTEQRLLAGSVLRGVSEEDLEWLGRCPFPITIVPADPEDRTHTRAIAEILANRIAGATLIRGTPVSPSPTFPAHRDAFVGLLIERLHMTPSSPSRTAPGSPSTTDHR